MGTGKHVPRAVFVDLEPSVIGEVSIFKIIVTTPLVPFLIHFVYF